MMLHHDDTKNDTAQTVFQCQERALFDLLFDAALRERFAHDRAAALAPYGLSPEALQDFDAIRVDALELDARMRADLMLASISKVLPLSFSVVSSFPDGLVWLRALLDTHTMRSHPAERALIFATRLREQLHTRVQDIAQDSEQEAHRLAAILDVERGMAWTAAARKRAAIEAGVSEILPPLLANDWTARPVVLAPYVSAGVLSQSYALLKQQLCVAEGAGLWRALHRSPVSAGVRSAILQQHQPRLLVARAWVSQPSACDPVVEHQTVELSEGFAALFQYVNGTLGVDGILAGLAEAGAPAAMLDGVRGGFRQLLEAGMLALVE